MTSAAFASLLLLCVPQEKSATKIYEDAQASVVTVSSGDKKGTGFVVGNGEYVVTCDHVVLGGFAPKVGELDAKLVFADPETDLALLQMPKKVANPLPIAETMPKVGAKVFVIGTPLGLLEKTLSEGIVSNVRKVRTLEVLQFTAPISAGSSGSPVLDSSGQVVGVASSTIEAGQSLNFAVPSSYLQKALSTVLNDASDTNNKAADALERAHIRNLIAIARKDEGDEAKEAKALIKKLGPKAVATLYEELGKPVDGEVDATVVYLLMEYGKEQMPFALAALKSGNKIAREGAMYVLSLMAVPKESSERPKVEWIATDTIKSEVLKLLDRDECDLQTLALIERLPIKGAGPKLSAAIERTDSADRAVRCFKALIATDEAFPLEELKIAYENTVITIAGHVGEDEKSTRTEQEAFRFQALEALGLCRSDNTYKLLVHLMDDDSSETRFLACWHLSGRPHEDTEKSIRVLLKDSNEHIRDGALLSLVRMGVQEHFRRAEGILLRHSLHTYRVLAALALGEGAKERALEPLLKAAGDRNADVRIQVCSSLVQIGSAKALPKLEQLTSDPEASVRRHAKTCLADLKTKLQEKEKTGG